VLAFSGLVACSTRADPTGESLPWSVDDEVAEANQRLAEQMAAAEAVAAEYVENAQDFWRDGDFGLALTESRAAVAAAPWYPPADRIRGQVVAAATAEAQSVAVATAEAIRLAQAAAERERMAQRAADQAEATRLLAFVESFDESVPPGGWLNSETPITVAVGNLSYFTEEAGREAPRGQRWVSLGVYVKNRSNARIEVKPEDFTLVSRNGSANNYDPLALNSCSLPLRPAEVRPGGYANGCLVFLAPADAGPVSVVYSSPSTSGSGISVDLQRFPDLP
jgi:hypothetical protein